MDYTCLKVSICHACAYAVRCAEVVHWTEEMVKDRKRQGLKRYDDLDTVINDIMAL